MTLSIAFWYAFYDTSDTGPVGIAAGFFLKLVCTAATFGAAVVLWDALSRAAANFAFILDILLFLFFYSF